MHVILIQPPDPPAAVPVLDSALGHATRFAPCWDLLCLRAYLLNRTRHTCSFVDCRLSDHLETGLAEAFRNAPTTRVAVVYATGLGLGEAVAAIELTRRLAPHVRIVACGPFPAQFPQHAAGLPHADFALAGDAEPILRNLLDNLDVEYRLRKVPGLIFRGETPAAPYWLPDLKSLSPPDWQGVFWNSYVRNPEDAGTIANLRLTRGHSRRDGDRNSGSAAEPFRVWPLERIALALQRCAANSITEVFLDDPPGVWTEGLLRDWCSALDHVNNTTPWALQLLPQPLSADLADLMHYNGCRRIEYLFPASDAQVLQRYECRLDVRGLQRQVEALHALGIRVHARFHVGGPEARHGEADRVAGLISALNFCPFSLHPFPLVMDSPLYASWDEDDRPSLESWLAWARDPWTTERPVPLWQGAEGVLHTDRTIHKIEKAVERNPRRRWRRIVNNLRAMSVIEEIEARAMSLFSSRQS